MRGAPCAPNRSPSIRRDTRLKATMDLIQTRTPIEFLRHISLNGKLFSSDYLECIFRGQADAAWPIIPSVLRSGTLVPYEGTRYVCPRRTNRDQIDVELHMMRVFARVLNRAGHHVPSEEAMCMKSYPMRALDEGNRLGRGEVVWPPRDYHALLALAQHNGLPTRCLDFSYSPAVAAYFAAAGALKQRELDGYSGEISVCVVAGLSAVQSYEFGVDPIQRWLPPRTEYCYQLIEAPAFFNNHLRAQKACFLAYLQLAPEKNAPCEILSLEQYFEALSLEGSRLYKITLSATHAEDLLHMLHKEGTDASTIFPTIAGCVTSMFERCDDEPPPE